MRRTLQRRISVAVVAALLGAAPSAAEGLRLDGVYLSKGLNPDGTEYRGVVDLTRHGDSYVLTWLIALAEGEAVVLIPSAAGVGVVDGGMLAVSYYSPRMTGTVLYRIEEDGRSLVGRWVVAGGNGGVYSETLTKVPVESSEPGPPEPSDQDTKPRTPDKRIRPSVGDSVERSAGLAHTRDVCGV